jgi:hypothetical protein
MNKAVIDFLIKAKRATYAGKGAEASPSRPGSHDLHFTEGDLLYIDTYLGGAKFSGKEEIFYRGEKIYECLFHGGEVE